ncbi:putative quinol monooxygenase [Pseudoduganella sp. UC29_106]|uniref:putative quinol monooxygenase n=1 Tax=Pseudoduganella sp. UC29_106 TaxID=3374553 RepID=UPI0037568151
MNELHQIAVLYAKPGREEALRDNLIALVAPSRDEEGNLRYDLYGDVNDPRRFIFIETWASAAAQRRHHEHGLHIRHFHENGDADVERRESFYVIEPIA